MNTDISGPRIKAARKALKMPQHELARLMGVHQSVVGHWESEKRGIPDHRIPKLMEIMGNAPVDGAPQKARSTQRMYCADRACGRCRSCVTRRLWREGKMANVVAKNSKRWLAEEDAILEEFIGQGPAVVRQALARVNYHRTEHAICVRAWKRGLSVQTADYSLKRLSELFGNQNHGVGIKRAWLKTGLLRAERKGGGRGPIGSPGEWRIAEADVETFIRSYPWAYDARRMFPKSHPLARLAADIQRRDPWLTLDEASDYLGVGESAVRRWCRLGVIPHQRRIVGFMGAGIYGGIVIQASVLPEAKVIIERRRKAAQAMGSASAAIAWRRAQQRAVAA